MRRRIIKQGHSTLTITLPSKWVKRFNLKPGDEIELNERESGLHISTEKKVDSLQRTELNIIGLDIPSLWKYFMAMYREGYDEVKIIFPPNCTYESPYKFFSTHGIDMKYGRGTRKHTPFETIQEITNRFIGFEVIEHHKDYCIIRDLSQPSPKEFDASLRRVFLLLQQMSEEIVEAITTNNVEIIRHTHDVDINVDKFHDYCARVLNKTELKESKKGKLIFAILYILELIGDEFKSIANHLISDMREKKLDNIRPLAEQLLEQFNKFYDIYYNFSKEKVVELSKRDIEIHFYLPQLYKKSKGKESPLSDSELEVFNHFRRISKYINAATELRIELES